jgi:tellurite methyltransferase
VLAWFLAAGISMIRKLWLASIVCSSWRLSLSTATWEAYWRDDGNHAWWEKPAPEVLDLIRSLSPEHQPNVLDLGCGLGRHAIAFGLAGFSVTATDASAEAVKHLADWAGRLQLSIHTKVSDVLDGTLPSGFFDVVVSYNVLYHGTRDRFMARVERVGCLLKPKGVFFFTCPSREDGKYGFGGQIAPHTFKCEKSVAPGDVHYFADERALDEMLRGFDSIGRWKTEGYWDNRGSRQFYSNWNVLVAKQAG